MPQITPNLWFDNEAEEATQFYTSVFPNSRIVGTTTYPVETPSDKPVGSVMTVEFELDGQRFVAINGGPQFTFTEAISLEIRCADQDEIDHFWDRLGEGGEHGPCGWLKDRYGVSWQVVPDEWYRLMTDADPEQSKRAMECMLKQGKIDIAEIRAAVAG